MVHQVFASGVGRPQPHYSVKQGAAAALTALVAASDAFLPPELQLRHHIRRVVFKSPTVKGDGVVFPCPLKEQEAVAAIKALEACMAAALADLRHGQARSRVITVDMAKISCFLMSAYVTSLDGMTKVDPNVKYKLIG